MPRTRHVSIERPPAVEGTTRSAEVGKSSSKPARKRNRYTPHACNRCKTAKVRCDGRLPCGYCSARDATTCYYAALPLPSFQLSGRQSEDEDNGSQMDTASLLRLQNEKLDLLIRRTAVMDLAYKLPVHEDLRREIFTSLPRQPLPLFQSSTSAFFCINYIDVGAGKLGQPFFEGSFIPLAATPSPMPASLSIVQGQIIEGEASDISGNYLIDNDAPIEGSPGAKFPFPSVALPSHCPLAELDGHFVIRMVQVYGRLGGAMYPIVDIAELTQKARCFFDAKADLQSSRGRHDSVFMEIARDDLAILKFVVAIALLAQGDMHAEMASRLFQTLRPTIEAMVWNVAVDLKDLVLMTLAALYHLHWGKWRLAWRLVGDLTRMVLELGLNREIVLSRAFPDPKTRVRAINTIWTIYVLEQHLSHALGFSNAMHGLSLELNFPLPVEAPFLTLMIEYARIGKQACDTLLSDKDFNQQQVSNWQEDYAFFQYRLERWTVLMSNTFETSDMDQDIRPDFRIVRTILDLRANHLRILVARAFLCTGLRNAAPSDIWTTSVNIAVDSVQVFAQMDTSTQEYRFHQVQFNHFLIVALDMLLFITTHRSSICGSPSANGEQLPVPEDVVPKAQQSSVVALNILRNLAETSNHSKHLWERVRGVASRLNLSSYLFPTAADHEIYPPAMHSGSGHSGVEETAGDAGLAKHHTNVDHHEPQNFPFTFPTGDMGTWEFHGLLSSPVFDHLQDLGSLADNTWIR